MLRMEELRNWEKCGCVDDMEKLDNSKDKRKDKNKKESRGREGCLLRRYFCKGEDEEERRRKERRRRIV